MLKYYDTMMHEPDGVSIDDKLKILYGKSSPNDKLNEESLLSYLQKWRKRGKNLLPMNTMNELCSTIVSLYVLKTERDKRRASEPKLFDIKTSILSTLAVEHSFSAARAIRSVFTALDYCRIAARTEIDQQFKYANRKDRGWSSRTDGKTRIGNYNLMDTNTTAPIFEEKE
jgi:hypothetical protein